jgi:uncharacterized cupredoxin-like copper-binding protein
MKSLNLWLASALLGLCLGAAAHEGQPHHGGPVRKEQKPWGIAADATPAARTVEPTMSDNMRFTPDRIEVRQGETLRIVLRNRGAMLHEFVLGSKKTLDEHAALMEKFPNMEHDEPYMARVQPGETGQIVWKFNRAGQFEFACLIPGHYQAGMVGKVNVTR